MNIDNTPETPAAELELADEERMIASTRRLKLFAGAIYAASVAVCGLFLGFKLTFSLAFGGAVAIMNLVYLERFCGLILKNSAGAYSAKVMAALSFYGRFGVVAAALWYFTDAGWISFPALILGLSIGPVAIFAAYFSMDQVSFKESHEGAY
ncbi:MAG: hypothetical protein HZB29_12370 [Nitrospinae bacterium]|nr:hypothetical protein [Nitrospinota bacterium]